MNDRWGKETRGKHGGYYTTEYGLVHADEAEEVIPHPWEECRGIGHSFGYNRAETLADYSTPEELITLLVDTVARGGNLLLDIGPTADGRIPVIMEERLLQMGEWLETNGEAIYGTRKWREHAEGDTGPLHREGRRRLRDGPRLAREDRHPEDPPLLWRHEGGAPGLGREGALQAPGRRPPHHDAGLGDRGLLRLHLQADRGEVSDSPHWIESPAPALHLPDLRGRRAVVTGVSMGIGRATAELLLENGAHAFGFTRTEDTPTPGFRETVEVNLVGSFLVTRHALPTMRAAGYGRILLIASMAGKEGNAGMCAYSAAKAGVIGLAKSTGKEVAGSGVTVNALAPAVIRTAMVDGMPEEQVEYMTAKIPMGRCGTLDEAASLACWIVSREASFNTGAVFDLSGGRATY